MQLQATVSERSAVATGQKPSARRQCVASPRVAASRVTIAHVTPRVRRVCLNGAWILHVPHRAQANKEPAGVPRSPSISRVRAVVFGASLCQPHNVEMLRFSQAPLPLHEQFQVVGDMGRRL